MSSFIEEQVLDIREIVRAEIAEIAPEYVRVEDLERRLAAIESGPGGSKGATVASGAPTSQGGTVPSTAPSLRSLEVGADLNGDAAGGAADARPADLGKTVASPPSTWSEEQKRAALSVAGAPSVHATCKEIARISPLFVEQREIDVLFDGPPGPEAGRFVEVEDAATGRSIGIGDWIPPSLDGYWRLRFRVRALDAEAKLLEAHKALDACHAAYAPTAEAAQLLSVHLVEAHGADLYGKPHSETIRCAHAKLAAMQRVVDAAVEVSAATTELAELHAIKRLDEAVRAMKEKRDHE